MKASDRSARRCAEVGLVKVRQREQLALHNPARGVRAKLHGIEFAPVNRGPALAGVRGAGPQGVHPCPPPLSFLFFRASSRSSRAFRFSFITATSFATFSVT
eukprot:1257734-Lingulodinium_polyedra.AAC.1